MGGGYGTGIPGGPGGGGGGRGGNVLGRMGGAGQLLYGAYIAKRFWTMTAQPTLMAMEEFQQTQMASMASIGMDVSGTSASLAMQAQFQRGQGAQQVFGGIQDIFSRAGIDNPVLNRLSAVATVGGGWWAVSWELLRAVASWPLTCSACLVLALEQLQSWARPR